MKNIFKSSLLLLCGAYLFASCADDNDSNPTLTVPATFSLNTPAYSAFNVDLKTSSGLNFTWSQPDYGGFPVAAQTAAALRTCPDSGHRHRYRAGYGSVCRS